jgi:hypothetical protein
VLPESLVQISGKNNVNEMDSTSDTAQERLVITAVFISSW